MALLSSYSEAQQRQALTRIGRAWMQINDCHRMSLPVFQLHENRNWGEWHAERRILSINARLAIECRWAETLDTLRHEMAHQWVHERARVYDETAHGPTWRRACGLFGANPRATAECQLEALTREHPLEHRKTLGKIQRLLALAESDNAHEAQLAALRASEEMFKHQIVQLHDDERTFDYRTVGRPTKRRPRWVFPITHILSDHFHIHAIWLTARDREWDGDPQSPGMLLEITGTRQNVEIAAYTYDFLIREGERLLRGYQQQTKDRSAKSKSQYLVGLYTGFQLQLDAQRQELLGSQADPRSVALLRQGDRKLASFFRSRYPRIARRGTAGVAPSAAFEEGRRQGKTMTIRGGITSNVHRGGQLTAGTS